MEIFYTELPVIRHITLLALNLRMTSAERHAIRAAEATDPEVSDLMYLMSKARYINLDDPMVIAGMNSLETKTLLAVGRATEILSADVQPGEAG